MSVPTAFSSSSRSFDVVNSLRCSLARFGSWSAAAAQGTARTPASARYIRTRISVPLDVERGMEVGGRPKEVAQRTDQFPRQLNDLHALVADNARGGDQQLLPPLLDGEFEGRSAVQLTCVDELYERGGLIRLHVHANLAPGCSHEHAIRLSPLQRARHP